MKNILNMHLSTPLAFLVATLAVLIRLLTVSYGGRGFEGWNVLSWLFSSDIGTLDANILLQEMFASCLLFVGIFSISWVTFLFLQFLAEFLNSRSHPRNPS